MCTCARDSSLIPITGVAWMVIMDEILPTCRESEVKVKHVAVEFVVVRHSKLSEQMRVFQ